uniref:Vomeronasal type-1 receptor n=1 Tax=Otolemur garnettii TaxID=30611 RepID=H0XX47_OTOGA
DSTTSKEMATRVIFLSQTIIGIFGNFSILYHYLFFPHSEFRLSFRHFILKHLMIANSLVILSTGVPQTLRALGLKYFFSDVGCSLLFYVQRLGRGMSIVTTCFLSVFQTIMISPMNSKWKDLKVKVPEYIGCSIPFCWSLDILVNFIVSAYTFIKLSSKNITKKDLGYCSTLGHDKILNSLYIALFVFPEVLFSGLIILSSSWMIFILYRHKQQVQHIHRTNVSSTSSPESRAIQSILVLVTTFVSFNTFTSIFYACIAVLYNPSWWLMNTTTLIALCFPTVSPFVLMSHDSTISRLCFLRVRNRKFP